MAQAMQPATPKQDPLGELTGQAASAVQCAWRGPRRRLHSFPDRAGTSPAVATRERWMMPRKSSRREIVVMRVRTPAHEDYIRD